MRGIAYTHDPATLRRLERLTAVNAALEVDLTGQVNAETVAGRHVGAVGGQVDFVRAAMASPGGRAVITLPSTARGGTISRIVPRLGDGVVTTSRADADVVVTEHGVADLRGMALSERARRLTAIADPAHREGLERHVAEHGLR
ncbi:acetyl-CoA hydrolase/transferase C-terminal domain-containing protein [Baekduia soli]|uniref:acetyl-CoA hydrolase/transferase C-terminal domain-containing protein n=1 Tax=Baekduia soli TaxID=496014 RepID=UPI00225DE0DD|nr:acetyl-CoA hydrolase/transferase C-terminal domain-containing protein [Baekduia soli]